MNGGGSSLEPSEKSSKEMARLTYESASAFIAREYDTLYLRGAVDISYNFPNKNEKNTITNNDDGGINSLRPTSSRRNKIYCYNVRRDMRRM